MKRKVLLLSLTLMMCAVGIVSAATKWGTFEGYNIIRLVVNGQVVTPEDTPPVNLKGRTMVPIAMLEQLGVKAEWDGDNYTVNVSKVDDQSVVQQDTVQITKDIITEGGAGLTLVNMQGDMTALVYFESISNYDADWPKLNNIFDILSNVNATYSRIEYGKSGVTQGVIEIRTQNYIDATNGVITDDQLQQLWLLSGPMFDGQSTNTPVITPTTGSTDTVFTSGNVSSKIKDTFNGFDEGNLYELDNGQIWKQTSYDYKYSYKYRPDVFIYKDGTKWYMTVEDIDKEVEVERLK